MPIGPDGKPEKNLAVELMKKNGIIKADAGPTEAQVEAAEDFLKAVHDSDPHSLVLAFKTLDNVCGPDDGNMHEPVGAEEIDGDGEEAEDGE